MAATNELDWQGFLTKKAFKTITKMNWKRRFFVFDSNTLTLKYYENSPTPNAVPKGQFEMSAVDLFATLSTDHAKPFEIKITSKGQTMFATADSDADAQALLLKIDVARRQKIAGDDGKELVPLDAAERLAAQATPAGEPGAKAFTWGVGTMLAGNAPQVQGMAFPQRVQGLKQPAVPGALVAGPEHAAALTPEGAIHAWGSNEFSQLALPGDFQAAHRPMPINALASRRVLALACGGSHTLAVVSEGGAPAGGVLMSWGTGTVGQLGLGDGVQLAEAPAVVNVPGTALSGGRAVPVLVPAAGLVSSGCITVLGEAFVWGDASIGRLGSAAHPDRGPVGTAVGLALVNAAKVFAPVHVALTPADVGPDVPPGAQPVVTGLAMGGSFTLFLVTAVGGPGDAGYARGPGGTLLVAGGLGIDITKDAYGWTPAASPGKSFERAMDDEIGAVPRRATPQPVTPFGARACVLAVYAGARHAAVVVAEDAAGGAPRLYTAGKGWLGHGGPDGAVIGASRVSTYFAPAVGALGGVDVVEAACGHSHTVARTADGRLLAWGRGDSGELGCGNLTDRGMPTPVRQAASGNGYTQVVAGSYFTAALADPAGTAPKSTADALAALRARSDELLAARAATLAALGSGSSGRAAAAAASEPAAAEPAKPAKAAAAAAPAPAPAAAAASDSDELPAGWDYDTTDDGEVYFIRPDGSTCWEDPRG